MERRRRAVMLETVGRVAEGGEDGLAPAPAAARHDPREADQPRPRVVVVGGVGKLGQQQPRHRE